MSNRNHSLQRITRTGGALVAMLIALGVGAGCSLQLQMGAKNAEETAEVDGAEAEAAAIDNAASEAQPAPAEEQQDDSEWLNARVDGEDGALVGEFNFKP